MRYEDCVDGSSHEFRLRAMREKEREKMRCSDQAVDVGRQAFARVADRVGLLLQRLQSPARAAVDVPGLGSAGAGGSSRNCLKVARAVAGREGQNSLAVLM